MKQFITITLLCFLVGCGGQKVPDGFPQKLVPVSVTLVKAGTPVPNVSISLVPETSENFRVLARTDANGTAKLETGVNVYTKPGVPPGNYKMQVIVQYETTIQELTLEQSSKMSESEAQQHQAKMNKELADAKKSHPVPESWTTSAKSPVKLTIPDKGNNFTIDIADEKTFVQ